MFNPILIHASSFNGFVVLDDENVIETIPADRVLGLQLYFCTITQEILDEVCKNGFAELKDTRQGDLFYDN